MKYMSPRLHLSDKAPPFAFPSGLLLELTGSVNVRVSLEHTDIVTLADTLNGSSETSKTSSDDEDVNAGVGVGA